METKRDYQKRIDALPLKIREAYERYLGESFESLLTRTCEGYITPRLLRESLEHCEACAKNQP